MNLLEKKFYRAETEYMTAHVSDEGCIYYSRRIPRFVFFVNSSPYHCRNSCRASSHLRGDELFFFVRFLMKVASSHRLCGEDIAILSVTYDYIERAHS